MKSLKATIHSVNESSHHYSDSDLQEILSASIVEAAIAFKKGKIQQDEIEFLSTRGWLDAITMISTKFAENTDDEVHNQLECSIQLNDFVTGYALRKFSFVNKQMLRYVTEHYIKM